MGADLKSVRRVGFKQADLTRALKAAKDADFKVGRFEIDPGTGKIVIMSESETRATPGNSWDEVL